MIRGGGDDSYDHPSTLMHMARVCVSARAAAQLFWDTGRVPYTKLRMCLLESYRNQISDNHKTRSHVMVIYTQSGIGNPIGSSTVGRKFEIFSISLYLNYL